VNSASFYIRGKNVMPNEYARIILSIGKVLRERRQATATDPLPECLAELLCRLSEREAERNGRRDATAKRSLLVQS